MKISIEQSEPTKPSISLVEKNRDSKEGRFPGREQRLTGLNLPIDPNTIKKSEYDDLLTESRESILNDEKLTQKMLLAILEKLNDKRTTKFADIENILIERCINLSENDIDSIVRQFNKKFIAYIQSQKGVIDIPGKTIQEVVIGKFNLNSLGVKSVVNFIRARSKLLLSNPEQSFIIGFNNHLDARNGIDLVEVIFEGEEDSDIDQLNFIQIKSSRPAEDEMEKIMSEHANFANGDMLSMREIDNLQLPKEEEQRLFEETISNQINMIEKIFEICDQYQGTDRESLIKLLGLDNLNNMQKAWVLSKYFEKIKYQIENTFLEGYIMQENKDALIRDLETLRRDLINKSGIPSNITPIKSVNSIIAVGTEIIKQKEVFNSSQRGATLAATA